MKRRRAFVPADPSWPRTDDQRKQSRPMIVIRPLKHLVPRGADNRAQVAAMCRTLPKCVIDGAVLAGWRSP